MKHDELIDRQRQESVGLALVVGELHFDMAVVEYFNDGPDLSAHDLVSRPIDCDCYDIE